MVKVFAWEPALEKISLWCFALVKMLASELEAKRLEAKWLGVKWLEARDLLGTILR